MSVSHVRHAFCVIGKVIKIVNRCVYRQEREELQVSEKRREIYRRGRADGIP